MTKRAILIGVQDMYLNEYYMIGLCSISPDVSWVLLKILLKVLLEYKQQVLSVCMH